MKCVDVGKIGVRGNLLVTLEKAFRRPILIFIDGIYQDIQAT